MESEIAPRPTKLLKGIMIALVAVSVGSSAGAYYFYDKYSNLRENPQETAQNEISKLLNDLGKLMDLPADEQPTVATVSEPEKLQAQPFFAKAKKGYKVVIYTTAKKAILYDPEANKIIEVAPVNIGNEQQAAGDQQNNSGTGTNTQRRPGTVAGDEDEE